MNEHVTNETPTEIAGDAGVLAEMAALRHRLAALEARLPGNAPEQQAKRRTSTKTVAWLTTGAVLAMLAGASLVYGQSAVDALFISKEGNVGIGTSTPLATAKLQVAGAGGGWFSPDATSGAGVRVWQDGATGSVFSYDYKAGGPRNLVLQQPGGNVGIGTATPQADNKLEVNGKIAATSLNVDSATMKSLTALGALTVEKDTTVKGPMKIEGNNVLEFGAGVEGKEVSAGKIGYQVFATKDALDIVGAGTADGKQPRKIKFWAEGGATFAGSLNVSGAVDGNMKVVYQRDDEAQTTYEKPLWRYHMSLMAAKYAGGSKTIPKDILTKLCGTRDGCEVRLGMTRWGNGSETQTASRSFRFYYSPNDGHWRSSDPWDREGVIGDGAIQHAADAWGTCFFTEGTYKNGNGTNRRLSERAAHVRTYPDPLTHSACSARRDYSHGSSVWDRSPSGC